MALTFTLILVEFRMKTKEHVLTKKFLTNGTLITNF